MSFQHSNLRLKPTSDSDLRINQVSAIRLQQHCLMQVYKALAHAGSHLLQSYIRFQVSTSIGHFSFLTSTSNTYLPDPLLKTAYPFSIRKNLSEALFTIFLPLSVTEFVPDAGTYIVAVLPTGTSTSNLNEPLVFFHSTPAFP